MNGLLKIVLIPGAVVSGDDHAGTYGNSVKKAHKQQVKAAGRADSSQSVAPEKISYNKGIGSIVILYSPNHHIFGVLLVN